MTRSPARQILHYLWASPNTLIGALCLPAAISSGSCVAVVDGVLEAQGPVLSMLLRRLVPIHGGAAAITLGHIVLGRDQQSLDCTRAHERVHVRQCEAWGPLFIPAYLIASLWAAVRGTGAYEGNYFERQARTFSESSLSNRRELRPIPSVIADT